MKLLRRCFKRCVAKFKYLSILAVLFFVFTSATAGASSVDELLEKSEIAPNPVPALTVTGYELSPEVFLPGDVGILKVTLKNTQEEPIEKSVELEEPGEKSKTVVETETTFTMDAFISEAYIVERDFKVFNRHTSVGFVGPGDETELAFKIKAPQSPGIYMLKFVADVEDAHGNICKGIRYYIPVTVSHSLRIYPQNVSEGGVELAVVNEGLGGVQAVFVEVSRENGVEIDECSKIAYIGDMDAGEMKTASFKINEKGGGNGEVCFVARFKNGINEHRTDEVCVNVRSESRGENAERGGSEVNEGVKKEEGEEGEERETETMWNESFAVNGSNTVDVHSGGNDEAPNFLSFILKIFNICAISR
ncbi:MAG: hypothetical protein N2V74_01365 [Candidatus Methanospirare jalkutatii]|nr:MAG: hypothetical protein N2V74_04500 [Candidatus Methanospirare jalkutatii]UYZ40375.1 MAG: hypothetical protein N2V74_01365 [Candidatus Methanospirare jalkutatii]